jgi:hypothetical protein
MTSQEFSERVYMAWVVAMAVAVGCLIGAAILEGWG